MREREGALDDPTAQRGGDGARSDAHEQEPAPAQARYDAPLEDLVVQVERSDAEVAQHPRSRHDEQLRPAQGAPGLAPFADFEG